MSPTDGKVNIPSLAAVETSAVTTTAATVVVVSLIATVRITIGSTIRGALLRKRHVRKPNSKTLSL